MVIGDTVNRLCILEIKQRRVADTVEIRNEIDSLANVRKHNPFFYSLLTYVNEHIWTLTTRIQLLEPSDPLSVQSSADIVLYEMMRNRIKCWFDKVTCDTTERKCVLHVKTESVFYDKLPEFVYTVLQYDAVYVVSPINNLIKTILPLSTLIYDDIPSGITDVHLIDQSYLDNNQRSTFELPTIQYIGSGLLGDFIHQLSVIQEMYRKTGRKGDLFISTASESFQFGIERAFKDTYDIITRQTYIASYQIDDGKKRDYIRLSSWRQSSLLYRASWFDIYKGTFGIDWAKHKWIEHLPVDPKWENTVLLNYSPKRSMVVSELKALYALYGDSITFVSFSVEDYIDCTRILEAPIPFYRPLSLFDMCVCINSCKMFIGGLTAPLALSVALHKPSLALKPTPDSMSGAQYSLDYIHFINLELHLPYVMRIV